MNRLMNILIFPLTLTNKMQNKNKLVIKVERIQKYQKYLKILTKIYKVHFQKKINLN